MIKKKNNRVIMWVPKEFKNAFTIERIKRGYTTNMDFARELSEDSMELERTLKKLKNDKKIKKEKNYKPFF